MNVRNFISLCLLHLVKCFLHVEHIQALTVLDVIYLAVIDTQCLSFSHHLVAGNMFHDDSVDDVFPIVYTTWTHLYTSDASFLSSGASVE